MVVFHSYSIAYQRVEKSRVDIIRDIFWFCYQLGWSGAGS